MPQRCMIFVWIMQEAREREMHELSLMTDAVGLVVADAASRSIARVTRIEMRVGELSGALPHALREAFPIAAQGTPAEGATLVIDEVKAEVRCKKCLRVFNPMSDGWSCPGCGSYDAEILSGTELHVVSYTGEERECLSK